MTRIGSQNAVVAENIIECQASRVPLETNFDKVNYIYGWIRGIPLSSVRSKFLF